MCFLCAAHIDDTFYPDLWNNESIVGKMEVNKSAVTTVIRKGDRRIILTHTT